MMSQGNSNIAEWDTGGQCHCNAVVVDYIFKPLGENANI